VDLGLLVGATRGFQTREKVPMSSRMSGVEIDIELEEPIAGPSTLRHERRHTVGDVAYTFRSSNEEVCHCKYPPHQLPNMRKDSLPTLMLSPATAELSQNKKKNSKDKGRAMLNDYMRERNLNLNLPLSSDNTCSHKRPRLTLYSFLFCDHLPRE